MSNKKHILVVDDELESLQGHLEEAARAGFETTTLRTTDEALQHFFDNDVTRFDLIVLDMMIPPPVEKPEPIDIWDGLRSGGHLLAILRRRVATRVPVLLLSNLAEDEIELEAWDRFEDWSAEAGQQLPDASSSDEVREALCRQFGTWIRAKRRTPPWHFPKLLEEMLEVAVGAGEHG